ncbi:hypothetical protein [Xanthomarina gelatinilytica]|uniref:hypothetical protein n=1 Tax=Xanthomarina gelatinilytica TaxID=1137281 RepID=UPI003AA939E8
MKKTLRNIIIILFLPLTLVGQNNDANVETLNKVTRITREVAEINLTEKEFNEGRAEGPIIYKSLFRKNGGWTAYYLHEKQDDNLPLRIKYSQTAKKGYDEFEFYYRDGKLIFAKLTEIKNRGKNKGTETKRLFYYKDDELIYTTESEKEKYAEYIKRTEKSVRKMIYE